MVDSHKILIPDQTTLNKYYKIAGPLYEFISKNCFEAENLSSVRNSLLPRLMSGKIRVNKNLFVQNAPSVYLDNLYLKTKDARLAGPEVKVRILKQIKRRRKGHILNLK